ncbi:uncharacterized protein LOC117889576 [Drosophila subobscura]|uniref:uncharacterized protein LOC117889576 n=1 Tax=Drosophila subobscura TaxID=7241 RepID=UPI00155A8E79|nr:uncharacterized protein LOC117889576 [Drosophila subobscura]XP_034649870.1 uncharacterized protein LOC117889576 [Drosophila subobscura]
MKLLIAFGLLCLWPVHIGWCQSADKKAEIAKLRSELSQALEASDAGPPGVITQPVWTKQAQGPATASKVIVDEAALRSAAALRDEIQKAVAQQGHTKEVLQLDAAVKAAGNAQVGSTLGDARQEMLGASQAPVDGQPNVVESSVNTPGIDLEQLQRLELSKRRTRDLLVLSGIEEDTQFTLGSDVDQWVSVQANGSAYLVGLQPKDLLVLNGDFSPLQTVPLLAPIDAMLSLERWSSHTQLQEGLLVVATQQQLLWHRLEPGRGLVPFWHWPLGSQASKLATFSLEGRDFVVLAGNRTLSVYSYDLEAEEFWIAQRLQLPETITAMAVLDTGRELLLAVGQTDVALIYAYNPRERPLGEAGLQLQLHQRVPAPQVAAIAAFQMGGRSYLALGGQRPQILAHVQGQLVPRTILGQNFGFVELFLPVAVRSYRDDLLLLVQHRVAFDTHTLLVLEVLIWTGEAFEAGLPPPCGIASQPNHITHGAGCMLDHEREAGLIGAALIRQQDQPPLLLVPRQEAPSGLFRLQTKLLPRNSETKDLQEIHEFMRQWVEEQDAIIRLVEAQLQAPLPMEEEFEEIHTPQLINEAGEIEELFVNEARWTAEDAAIDLRQLLQQIRQLEQELQGGGAAAAATMHRAKRQPETLYNFHYDRLEVDSCEADVLLLEQLNHAPFYVQNKSLLLPAGTLNVQRLELLQLPAQPLHAESHERLQLEGSLACETINGLAWSQLLQDLVWRHRPLQLSQLHVQGAVIFEDALHLSSLNELRFPEDYLWSQGNGTSVVHAPKEFTQTLAANVVDTTGTINEMRPEDAITLSDAQDWPGLVTFSQLEVSEELELNGSAQGRQFEEAPLNPTLLETHHIRTADCHFVQLHVHGSLHLRGQLDNDSYDALLGDLLQRSADPSAELLVAGAKRIVGQLQLPVDTHVADSKLSGIPLEHFVTKHTAQMLRNLTQLPAYVYFHRLQLPPGASYDGVQLEQLLGEALRLDGAALSAPGTRLRFAGPAPVLAGGLRLEHSLNQVPLASGYQTLREPLHLQRAGFQRLEAEQAQVGGAVRGLGLLNGQRLGDLLQEEPHSWSGEVHVQELILPHGVQAQELQGIRAELLLDFLQQLDELPLLILQGQLQVERIAVSGSVQVEGALNGRDLEQLQREVIWLDRSNEMRTRWQLQQPPVFASDLHILGSFNERLLPELLADIVFRSDSDSDSASDSAGEVIIEGTKSFTAPLRVADELHLEALNGVPFERLANRRQPLNLAGNVRLQGRLQAASVQLRGALNNDPLALAQLEQLLHWDAQSQAFVQRGRVALLPGGTSRPLEDLTVLGHLGTLNEEPLQQLFEQLIFKQQPHIRIDGHKLFTGRVSMPEGAHIQQLNGLDLEQLLSQLIFIDGEQQQEQPQEVETPVHFAAPIRMEQLLAERLLLTGQLLNGCNISDWLLDTVRVDRDWQGSAAQAPITFAAGSLDHNSLTLEQLNHLNLSHLVTLHTEQQLLAPFVAEELLLDGVMEVQGLVNGRQLSQEYANTLMMNSPVPQTVETPLLLPGIHVRGPLQVKAPINGDASLNLSDVASLEEPQLRLQSPLYFSRLHAPALTARQRLNAFDYVDWHARSLWARGRPEQTISGNWRVKQLRVKQAALGDARNRRQTMEQMEQHYRQLCQRLSKMFGSLRLPYQVQKLKRSFTLRQPKGSEDVRRIFGLEADLQPGGPSTYLLVNERGCWTRIHRWNGTRFAHAGAFRSGPVDEVIGLQLRNNSGRDFAFMTSHEMDEGEHESTWNCTGAAAAAAAASVLQSWHTDEEQAETEPLAIPVETLQGLKQQQKELQKRPLPGSYQAAIKYLQRPPVESELGPHWGRRQQIGPEELHALRRRLLETLNFRLQTEVNITQLSIPESDLYDEQLVEDFLQLMQQLRGFRPRLHTDTLPLPDSPARVLAARSAQLIWPVLQELRELAADDGSELALEETLLDVLELANNGSSDQTLQLHAVIGRLRQLQEQLQLQQQHGEPMASASSRVSEQTLLHWRPVQTLRLLVGPKNRSRLLYARLTRLDPHEGDRPTTPSSAPPAHIQLHHANGSLFQSLAADRQARQLTALRVRDETLLAFVEGCCQIRVFIYRGVQGFVPFARFRAHRASEESPVVQLLALRLPLQRSPGAVYALAVAQARRITFYELVIAGQLEPWLKCN